MLGRATATTYCCDSKISDGEIILGHNRGSNCKKSITGQCNIGYGIGQNYKFRCFKNPEDISKPDEYKNTIDTRNDANPGENCEYISGITSKVGKVALVGAIAATAPFRGGKNSVKKINKTHRKTQKRKCSKV